MYVAGARRKQCACEVESRRRERHRQLARLEFGWPALWSDMAELGLDPETGDPIGVAA